MLKFANEMYSYASKLEPDEKGKRLLAGAYTKLGIVYSSQDKRAEAFKAWDTAISITPDADTIIYVYCLKLSDFWSQKYAEERNEIMEACRREYNKIRVTEKFRELSSYRQSVLTSYSGAVDSYCFSLLFVKDFSRMKQMILDF